MRPVNLIPTEERRGNRTPMRSGPLAYIVLGALVAAVFGVVLLVTADNQISSRTTEVKELKAQTASAEAEANRLAPYTQFHTVSAARTVTVANLANSRFNWDKVLQELALVLPGDVTLSSLTGTVRPDVSVGGGASIALRTSIPGPALSMGGCAAGQEAVASFVNVLKGIDGVTRVGLQSSQAGGSSGSSGESESANGGCGGDENSAEFQLVVAFDAAPVPASATGTTEVVAPAPEEAGTEEPAPESTPTAAEGE
jgi:Tfp pilus assembly protein PilN